MITLISKSKDWSGERLDQVTSLLDAAGVDAAMLCVDGNRIAQWGDNALTVNVRSMRKAMLSTLYGIAVADGRIDLDLTLVAIGIADKTPLTETESQASIRDLLMSRSGVYLQAAYETSAMKENRPVRGSAKPGSVWWYNNWDFNALGAIYIRLTGEDIFEAVEKRLARPLGMEDFSAADGRYVYEPVSAFPAYTMRFSARDLARFGQMMLNDGKWQGEQVLPAAWVRESTRVLSATDRRGLGYGYLWWPLTSERGASRNGYLALGAGGQAVAILPALRLVYVQLCNVAEGNERSTSADVLRALQKIVSARPR